MIKSVKINVYGKVQGVGFRYSTVQKANELGICGFVKNRNDGSVYIEAEGEPDLLESFTSWLKQGPTWAGVDEVVVNEIPLNNYTLFIVK